MDQERLGYAESVAGVRAQRVVSHELLGDLLRERSIQAAADVDRCQFPWLDVVACFECHAFHVKRGLSGICL